MQELNLVETPLRFEETLYTNLFRLKNNKTLLQTLQTSAYQRLTERSHEHYAAYLDMPLGEFLFMLKEQKDPFYKSFLNLHGDKTYGAFALADTRVYNQKGLYFYFVDEELKYVGRCKDAYATRINNGYGKISPKNCMKDGQSTNCKINALVTYYNQSICLKLYPMEDNSKIEKLEKELIAKMQPEWNGRK